MANWGTYDLGLAKDFFSTNPSADTIYNKVSSLRLSSDSLADLYTQSMGGTFYDALQKINNYLSTNNKSLGYRSQQIQQTPQTIQPVQQPTQQISQINQNNSLPSLYNQQNSVYNSGINNNTTSSIPTQMASSTKGNYLSGSYSNDNTPIYGNRMNQMNNSRGAGFFQPTQQMSF